MRALILVVAVAAPAAEQGQEIKLWPDRAAMASQEVSKPSVNPKYGSLPGNFTVTHDPSIYVFLPPKERATGAAVVIAPGGGHRQLVMEKEGWEFVDWLNDLGIAAFVLKYRLAKAPGSTYKLEDEVHADAAQAMRVVRGRAKEWELDPKRIGFAGFSAGGEVAMMIGTKFDNETRPDFNILIYPWYRPGAREPDGPQPFPMPADGPTTFMVCTTEDHSHVVPTVKYYLELEARKIPVEMHIYQSGPHGFGLRPTKEPLPVNTWPDRLKDCLYDQKILVK
jgi:acetyl esterase/lipase